MIWGGLFFWGVIWAVIGSYGTAYIHERQGRDVTGGGFIGLLVGFIGGPFILMVLWVWLYYAKGEFTKPANAEPEPGAKRWYNWWN